MSDQDNEAYQRGDDIARESAQASGALDGGGGAAATMRKEEGQVDPPVVDYASAGRAFTGWFNEKLHLLPNTQIRLGLRTAQAVRLHPDGRLECSLVAGAGEPEQTFVAFEPQHLDQLIRKIGALGL